jgi:hypothetical protein
MPYWVARFRDIDWFKVKNLREMLLRLVHVWPTNSLLFTPHLILDAENKKWPTEDLSLWYRDRGIMDQSFVANRKQLSIFC